MGVVQTGRDRDKGRGIYEKVWKGSIGTTTSAQVEETDGEGSMLGAINKERGLRLVTSTDRTWS